MSATACKGLGLVLVQHEYEYMGRDGDLVCIKPNERYILLSKTNDNWWQVRKDEHSKPFYIPAKYVKELPSDLPFPMDFIHPKAPTPPRTWSEDRHEEVAVRMRPGGRQKKTENRISTFGVPLDSRDTFRRGGLSDSVLALQAYPDPISHNNKRPGSTANVSHNSQLSTEELLQLSAKARVPSFSPADPKIKPNLGKPVEPPTVRDVVATSQVKDSTEESKPLSDPDKPLNVDSNQPQDAENIYECIMDVQDLPESDFDFVPPPAPTNPPPPPPQIQEENQQHRNSALYVNVGELKNTLGQASSTVSTSPGTAHVFWENPFSPPPVQCPVSPPASIGSVDIKQVLGESGGQSCVYSTATGKTPSSPNTPGGRSPPPGEPQIFKKDADDGPPPLPKEDYLAVESEENEPQPLLFPKDLTIPRVKRAILPWSSGDPGAAGMPSSEPSPEQSQTPRPSNGVDADGGTVMKNWRHTIAHHSIIPGHGDSVHILDKAGITNKTKIAENGKKLRKNWSQSWTVLHDGILTFHKDPKSTPPGASNKSSQIAPEFTLELRGATISWAPKEKSSKKNVVELKTRHGTEYLMQYDTESVINDWYKAIGETIRQQDQDHHSEEEDGEGEKSPGHMDKEDRDKKRISSRMSSVGIPSNNSSSSESEQGKVRNKLRKFLQRRPTLQSVKERGYIRDNVFGCHLDTLCHRENTTTPSFVEKCIMSVEKRGLDIDGIYRVSGNLAVIQKLRYKVDHEENLDLEDGQWEEIHVITGALKLFFRELPEPLFPFSHFHRFIAAIKLPDYNQRVSYIIDLVKSLPLPNHNTMKLLFQHLRKVIEFREANRMSVQSVAIVFGPTLLRPEEETANITVHMIFQTQIVELILNEYDKIFCAT